MAEGDFVAVGGCLCGAVRFGLKERLAPVGFCHCSICRKASGVASSAVLSVRRERFAWISGEDAREVFSLPSGWSNCFCRTCGCPAPQATPDGQRMWVPAGVLEGDPQLKIAGHIFVGSKASWELICDDAPQFEGHAPSS